MRIITKALMATAAVVALGSAAQAADLLAPAAPLAPAYVAPTANWEGPYIGANLGWGWGTVTPSAPDPSFDINGGMIGGQIGYNFYLSDGIVLGLQADIDWANLNGDDGVVTNSDSINWEGALTAHLGFAVDSFMPYVLGGVAFAGNTLTNGGVSEDQTHTGWTVGAGAEVLLTDGLSAFAEFRHSDFGSRDYAVPTTVDLSDNSVRAGLNFHF